jgi:polysaccharide deacetylase 2 family uncharacterized protein YibQ
MSRIRTLTKRPHRDQKNRMILHRRIVLSGLLAAPAIIRGQAARADIAERIPTPMPPASAADGPPRWQRYAVKPRTAEGKPIITVVIDDLGVMEPGTARAVALPAPLTLSWFPFAHRLPEQVAGGAARGHEATLHMPMQAFGNSTAWTGPDPLRIDLPPEENLRRLVAALDAVPDTVGLNNHMGSVATRDTGLMSLVAAETKRRDMLFLDSLTIQHSVAYKEAAQAGVPAASRDLFIDDKNDPTSIAYWLAAIEATARRRGNVIAIGHPRAHTLDALEKWLPTLEAKGFVMWPLSATVALRNEIELPAG